MAHPAEIDPGRCQQLQGRLGKAVLAHGRDMAHLCPGAPRRQRLIGALAARGHGKYPARHRFARLGQARHGADLVEIGGAENRDHASIFSIVFQLRIVSSAPLSNWVKSGLSTASTPSV